MKKFLAVMFVMLFAALALTACGFASEKDGAQLYLCTVLFPYSCFLHHVRISCQ